MTVALSDIAVVEDWESPKWRINSGIYQIVDAQAEMIPFTMNASQEELYDNLWYRNLVLKGRQQGFSTEIGIIALDQCMFNKTFRTGIIAQTLPDCTKLFRLKIEKPYLALPADLRDRVGKDRMNATELVLGNGSSIQVSMSMRGDTLNLLHVSEFGKICKQSPERAREIVTGAFKTLGNGQILFVESTAEGEGYYKDYCMTALERQRAGMPLTEKDFRLHFFAWWRKEANRLDPTHVIIDDNMQLYFDELETKHGIFLDAAQKAWYVKEAETSKGDMHREEPSYPEEAFMAHVKGAIYAEQMVWLRKNKRITNVPWEPTLPVNTFWDFGVSTNNETTIWFHQRNGAADSFIRYYEAEGKGLLHFVEECKSHGYIFGTHYLPHDGAARLQGETVETREQILNRLGIKPTVIVPRASDLNNGIELTQARMPTCWIDEENCANGIKALDGYVRKWDTTRGCFTIPLHNWASNGADSFRQWGQADRVPLPKAKTKPMQRNWRVL